MRKLIFALLLLAAVTATPSRGEGTCDIIACTCDDAYMFCLTQCIGLVPTESIACKSGCGVDRLLCKAGEGALRV